MFAPGDARCAPGFFDGTEPRSVQGPFLRPARRPRSIACRAPGAVAAPGSLAPGASTSPEFDWLRPCPDESLAVVSREQLPEYSNHRAKCDKFKPGCPMALQRARNDSK